MRRRPAGDPFDICPLAGGDSGASDKAKGDQPVNLADLIQPGALDDIAIGKANAPVTIVQYVSLNCANLRQIPERLAAQAQEGLH